MKVAESNAVVLVDREVDQALFALKVMKEAFGKIRDYNAYRAGEKFKDAAKAVQFKADVKSALKEIRQKGVMKKEEWEELKGAIQESIQEGNPGKFVKKAEAKQSRRQAAVRKAKKKAKAFKAKFGKVRKQLGVTKANGKKHSR